jgi:hypothetical protein
MVFQNPGGWSGARALVSRARRKEPAPSCLIAGMPSIKIAPMVDDPDIWRAANLLLKRPSADAETVAAMRADELLASGDVEGCAIWKRILVAVTDSHAPHQLRASG